MNSNRSNFDSKALKKNLDKLSECSSLTRFEAGNTDLNKNSLIIPTEENSPIRQKINKNSMEMFEDIECTKKIVENLSEVSSILQEESQNFSVSDQIMFENLDKNSNNFEKCPKNLPNEQTYKTNKDNNFKKVETQHPIEQFSQIFTPIIQKKAIEPQNYAIKEQFTQAFEPNFKKKTIEKEEENKVINMKNKSPFVPLSSIKNEPGENERNEIRNNKMFENPFKSMNCNSQSTLFSNNDYRLYNFKDRIQKSYAQFRQTDKNKDCSQLYKEIVDMILENNKSPLNLEDYHNKMFQELKDFYYISVPKGSELSRSFLEKNRSNSANSTSERKETVTKTNIKVSANKALNIPSNGSFIRTHTEKGFYDTVDKTKKAQPQPFHYIKYGSINLQDPINMHFQDKNLVVGVHQ